MRERHGIELAIGAALADHLHMPHLRDFPCWELLSHVMNLQAKSQVAFAAASSWPSLSSSSKGPSPAGQTTPTFADIASMSLGASSAPLSAAQEAKRQPRGATGGSSSTHPNGGKQVSSHPTKKNSHHRPRSRLPRPSVVEWGECHAQIPSAIAESIMTKPNHAGLHPDVLASLPVDHHPCLIHNTSGLGASLSADMMPLFRRDLTRDHLTAEEKELKALLPEDHTYYVVVAGLVPGSTLKCYTRTPAICFFRSAADQLCVGDSALYQCARCYQVSSLTEARHLLSRACFVNRMNDVNAKVLGCFCQATGDDDFAALIAVHIKAHFDLNKRGSIPRHCSTAEEFGDLIRETLHCKRPSLGGQQSPRNLAAKTTSSSLGNSEVAQALAFSPGATKRGRDGSTIRSLGPSTSPSADCPPSVKKTCDHPSPDASSVADADLPATDPM